MQFSNNIDLLQLFCKIWTKTRYYTQYILRRYLLPFRKVGDNHSIIAISKSRIIISGSIDVERFIIGVTKIKLMGTNFHKTTKGNIMDIDVS